MSSLRSTGDRDFLFSVNRCAIRKLLVRKGVSAPLVTDYGEPYLPPSVEVAQGNEQYRQWDPIKDPFAKNLPNLVSPVINEATLSRSSADCDAEKTETEVTMYWTRRSDGTTRIYCSPISYVALQYRLDTPEERCMSDHCYLYSGKKITPLRLLRIGNALFWSQTLP